MSSVTKLMKMTSECKQITKNLVGAFMSKFDTVLFDCDGVLWHSSTIVAKAPETIRLLKKHGKRVFYITNNSTKTRADYLKKLESMGFEAQLDEMLCTAHVAATYLKNNNFKDKVYLIGQKSMEDELTANGIRWTKHENEPVMGATFGSVNESNINDPEVKCVLVGADSHFNFEKLSRACLYLYRNDDCMFLGTNVDPQFPLADGRALPGTGAIIAAVATASGRKPIYIGKPERPMFDVLRETFQLEASRTLMVGDRLGTDIKLAKNNDLLSLFVLTGMHDLDDVAKHRRSDNPDERQLVPDFYIESVTKWAEFMADL